MLFRKERTLIVGLGNPGSQYKNTRHNVGFQALDRLTGEVEGGRFRDQFEGETVSGKLYGRDVILLRPHTFMNLSGQSVAAAARFYKIPPERVYVIFDDISLSPGKLRIRAKGSAGGHNGIKDIIEDLGSDAFMHIKVGVGAKPHPDYDLKDWVLGVPNGEDRAAIDKVLDKMPALFKSFFSEPLDRTMNKFNGG